MAAILFIIVTYSYSKPHPASGLAGCPEQRLQGIGGGGGPGESVQWLHSSLAILKVLLCITLQLEKGQRYRVLSEAEVEAHLVAISERD